MKNLRLALIASIIFVGLEELPAQRLNWLLLQLIQNDQNKIKPELWSGPFFASYKDSQRDYRWKSTDIGLKTDASLGIFTLYSEIFYENYKGEYTAFTVPVFEKSKDFRIELGAGIKVPVQIAETGIQFEGEMTSPFGEFKPSLEFKLGWIDKRKRFKFYFGNKIVAGYASIFNPTLFFGYRIY